MGQAGGWVKRARVGSPGSVGRARSAVRNLLWNVRSPAPPSRGWLRPSGECIISPRSRRDSGRVSGEKSGGWGMCALERTRGGLGHLAVPGAETPRGGDDAAVGAAAVGARRRRGGAAHVARAKERGVHGDGSFRLRARAGGSGNPSADQTLNNHQVAPLSRLARSMTCEQNGDGWRAVGRRATGTEFWRRDALLIAEARVARTRARTRTSGFRPLRCPARARGSARTRRSR